MAAPQVLLLGLLVLTEACGYRKTMVFPSPSKRASVEIWQTRIESSFGMRVQLVTGERRFLVYKSPNEAYPYFVHVYWSSDETKVGILATGIGSWELAYSTRTAGEIPFGEVSDGLARSIAQTYHLETWQDPIDWARTPEASTKFFDRHPEIHVSYGPNN